ncbi:hypothetical protein CTAM01_02995 [Colletotrichum tamarilloi]|uniref:Uncharacterized protein n=1 Tax=Colletotrichum tamarilloi TaxID=1209934 RepID=A0ABQ9RKV9_9PEZI|nr:uncharacterized protein CTAM01_02995 [Colletotrichum tamarilloi]KAK1506663.1 hypothetical protein CTAM01_02995 [Colletotrichum tamarilloi]
MTRSSQGSQPQACYRLLFSSAFLLNSNRSSAAAVSIASGSKDSKPLRSLLFQVSIFTQASPARKKVSKGPPRRQLSRPATSNEASEGMDWLLSRNTRSLPDRSLPSLPNWWKRAPLKLRQAVSLCPFSLMPSAKHT